MNYIPELDPYDWAKHKIASLIKNVQGWDNHALTTKNLDIWSIKKILALDYYIDSYVKILRKNDFRSWYYVDLFSGSGLVPIGNGQIFPGSPLIPLFKMNELPFDKYIFCDMNSIYIRALEETICNKIIKPNELENKAKIDLQVGDSNILVQKIFSGTKPAYWKSRSYLVFIDPFGWNISWNSMERILQSGPVDIIFTFMTWLIRWNMDIQNSEKSLNEFFGDNLWKSKDRTQIVDYYCDKIKSCGYMNKYKTYTIEVQTTSGNLYNLILASQSSGAGNVFSALQKRVNAVTTDCIQAATDVITGKSTDLSDYFNLIP